MVTKQRRPTCLIKCLFSLIIGCLERGRVQTLMNKQREKWEGSKLEGKTEESIELWLHTPSLSQTLSNRIFRSRLLPSLRLCCYGDVCSRSSHQLQIVSKWQREKKREQEREKERERERDARRQEEMEEMWTHRDHWKMISMDLRLIFKCHLKVKTTGWSAFCFRRGPGLFWTMTQYFLPCFVGTKWQMDYFLLLLI